MGRAAGQPIGLNRGNQITVRLDRRTFSPILRQADLPTVQVPWWGGPPLQIPLIAWAVFVARLPRSLP